jgi:hypothetical protein
MGLDWQGVICVFIATFLLTGSNPATRIIGFAFMILANWFFFFFGWLVSSEALMVSSVVFVALNIYGITRNILYLKGKE